MLKRLGTILYVFGMLITVPALLWLVVDLLTTDSVVTFDGVLPILIMALIPGALGWAIRFIFTGQRSLFN
jgi:hypothetical protein